MSAWIISMRSSMLLMAFLCDVDQLSQMSAGNSSAGKALSRLFCSSNDIFRLTCGLKRDQAYEVSRSDRHRDATMMKHAASS